MRKLQYVPQHPGNFSAHRVRILRKEPWSFRDRFLPQSTDLRSAPLGFRAVLTRAPGGQPCHPFDGSLSSLKRGHT